MKRALATALGAMMVAGSAAPASAASQIDFSGYYRVYNMNETNMSKEYGDATFTDSFLSHRLNIDLVFRATDEISVYWRLRAPTFKRFGNTGYSANDAQGRTGMVTHHIYGQIVQDWGTLRIGQIDDAFDHYGLSSLGYRPATDPMWTGRGVFDGGNRIEGVRYNNKWDSGFGITAQYQKVDNNDVHGLGSYPAGTPVAPNWGPANGLASDQDFDRFIIEPSFEWDGGGAVLGLRYDRNATGAEDLPAPYVWTIGGNQAHLGAQNTWFVNPAVMHSWGNFGIHFEGMYASSSQDVDFINPALQDGDDDADGYAFYLDGDYNYGPGNVTLAGWWVSGTDVDDTDRNDAVDISPGASFMPLIVAYNGSASGWGRNGRTGRLGTQNAIDIANRSENFVAPGLAPGVFRNNNGKGSNHWALALTGNHSFTDDITMHYGLAYLALNNPNYEVIDRFDTVGTNDRWTEQEKDLGFETDLSFSFQLLDNLAFVTSFGYMFNGDAYNTLTGYTAVDSEGYLNAIWEDADDSYVWYNTLTFSF